MQHFKIIALQRALAAVNCRAVRTATQPTIPGAELNRSLRASIGLKWTAVATEEACNMLSTASLTSRAIAICIFGIAVAPSAEAALPDDACSLLTPAQVGAALGVSMGAGTYVTPTFKKTCTWNATTSGGGTVTLNLQSLDQYEAAKKSASLGNPVSATSIGGPGVEAYYFGTDAVVGLIVKKGNVAFKVAVYAQIPVEKRQAAEKALAVQVLSRL